MDVVSTAELGDGTFSGKIWPKVDFRHWGSWQIIQLLKTLALA
jgi:hypothetical protein